MTKVHSEKGMATQLAESCVQHKQKLRSIYGGWMSPIEEQVGEFHVDCPLSVFTGLSRRFCFEDGYEEGHRWSLMAKYVCPPYPILFNCWDLCAWRIFESNVFWLSFWENSLRWKLVELWSNAYGERIQEVEAQK